MWFRTVVATCVLLIGGSLVSVVDARQTTRSLQGTVTDQTEAVLIGVSVVLDDGDGRVYTSETDEAGRYLFDDVQPGVYTLTVSAEAFATVTEDVDLRQPQRDPPIVDLSLNVLLEVQVDVENDLYEISDDPYRNLSSFILTGRNIQALPGDPRMLMQRLAEMAGYIGGPEDVAFYVDGFRLSVMFPPKGVIQMIRIGANPFDAEYAEPGQQRVEIITKPGAGLYLGEVDVGFSDESLNARNPFTPVKPPQQYRRYTGYLGEPLIPDRWGFLLYGGQWDQDENASVFATTLDPQTLEPQRFVTTVPTPSRVTSFSAKLNQLAGERHTLSVTYEQSRSTFRNLGLESGFDLPERAFGRSLRENSLRASWMTFFQTAVNELRVQVSRRVATAGAQRFEPAVLVLDAFNSGGNQDSRFLENGVDQVELAEDLTWTHGTHTFKAGMTSTLTRLQNDDRSNFGGTFLFGTDVERNASGNPVLDGAGNRVFISPLERYQRTLLGRPGYGPSQFSINIGTPQIGVTQWTGGWFAQDDWRLSPRATLSLGVRHDLQTNLDDHANLAPRVALAWVPDEARKGTIRTGIGVFYEQVSPDITFTARKFNTQNQQQLIVSRPDFFPAVPENFTGDVLPPSATYVKAPDLRAPRFVVSSLSYERELTSALLGSIGYTWRVGRDLLRLRNVNAPRTPGGPLPEPERGPVLQFESTGASTRHELKLALRVNAGERVTWYVNYTLGSTRTDTDGAFTTPADPYDLSSERGPQIDDSRHGFVTGGSLILPGTWYLSPYVTVTSAVPFNITTGLDNNGDALFTDRPAFARPGDPNAIQTRFGLLTPNPQPGDLLIPRNFGREGHRVNVSLNLLKELPISLVGGQVVLGVDAQNLLNNSRLIDYNGILISPVFGEPNRGLDGRRIEVSLKFNF